MKSPSLPTSAQTMECFRVCYQLTTMYRFIYLVRLDERTEDIVVLASEEFVVTINQNGETKFL
jgi:NMD protein affecting ribosome stability and mRNA decay